MYNRGGGRKLLLSFLVFTVLGYLCFQLVQIRIHGQAPFGNLRGDLLELLRETSMPGNKPLWFLVSLFTVKIFATLLGNHRMRLCLLPLAIIAAYTMQRFGFTQCLLLPTTLTGWFFYEMGHLYKDNGKDKHLVGLCMMWYVALLLTTLPIVDMRSNTPLRGDYLLWFPASLSGIMLFNFLFSQLRRDLKVLKYVGRHAMDFYVWHGLLLTLSTPVWHYILHIDGTAQVVANVVIISLCIPIIIRLKTIIYHERKTKV